MNSIRQVGTSSRVNNENESILSTGPNHTIINRKGENTMIAVGIDVSKSKSTVAIIQSDGTLLLKPRDFSHTASELSQLANLIRSFKDETKIALESTSHYHYPIVKSLINENFSVFVVNPFLVKKFMDNTIRKGKTDKKDAVRIAHFVLEKSYQLKPFSPADQKYDDLKFLSRQYNQCISMKVKARVQTANLLDEIMPGIQDIIPISSRYLENTLFFDFIEKYQNYENILRMGEKRFTNSYITFAQKHQCRSSHKKALAIYETAANSITTRNQDTTTSLALSQCLLMLKQASTSSDLLMRQMQSIAYTLPEYPVVRAMHGVGDRLAPLLIAEIGDIRRFTSAKALNAYAGNDAPPYQSGQFEGTNRHISKRGSSYLRKACYEVMHSLKVHKPEDDAVYQFILKKESEGKHKTVAKMAGVNKFLHIYYARVMEVHK